MKKIVFILFVTLTLVGVFLTRPLLIMTIIDQSLSSFDIIINDNDNNDMTEQVESEDKPETNQVSDPTPVEPKPEVLAETREFEVLRLVNIEREKNGNKPLTYLSKLEKGANIRALEIIELWSHTRPDGTSFSTAFEYMTYRTLGENLAAGYITPTDVVAGWMSSEGHRLNMLNENYDQMAIAVAEDADGRLFWVQILYRGR